MILLLPYTYFNQNCYWNIFYNIQFVDIWLTTADAHVDAVDKDGLIMNNEKKKLFSLYLLGVSVLLYY